MSNFKVGQKVVCLINFKRDEFDIEYNVKVPLKNEIYTIRAFDGNDSIYLQEIINPNLYYDEGYGECSFDISRFRPLDHAFADEVEAMIKEQLKEEYV